jgi:hypothetical protein
VVNLSVVQRSVTVSQAGQWDQLTGSLVLNVHSELSRTEPTIFSFRVRNSLTPQLSPNVWVMAGGQSPIVSTRMEGTVMQIVGANSSATKTCSCTPQQVPRHARALLWWKVFRLAAPSMPLRQKSNATALPTSSSK